MFNHSHKNLEQDHDQRLPGEIWSDYQTNIKSVADEARVVKTRYARLANATPEDFQRLIAGEKTQTHVEPPVERIGGVATEHLVGHQ